LYYWGRTKACKKQSGEKRPKRPKVDFSGNFCPEKSYFKKREEQKLARRVTSRRGKNKSLQEELLQEEGRTKACKKQS